MMTTSEVALWKWIREHFGKYGKWQRIENILDKGTPDVHYCIHGVAGWIELKQLECWPHRDNTTVKLEHFTLEQKLWLQEYAMEKGVCWLWLRVGKREHLLIKGEHTRDVGALTRAQLIDLCTWHHVGNMPVGIHPNVVRKLRHDRKIK